MSVDLVQQTKDALLARGEDLSGPCGAFKITKRVAWALRSQGYCLLSKPSGNNCEGYSVDYVVHVSGQGYDILGDAGGANTPGWNPGDTFTSDRLAPPIDPGDTAAPVPVPLPDAGGAANPFDLIIAKLDALIALKTSVTFPVYEGRLFGYTITLTPKK